MNCLSAEQPWLDGIEGEAARTLIMSDNPVIRVVAGPGSGKTTCLKHRTQRLIQANRIVPKTVFVGTFTRAVTNELKEALGNEVNVSTLHALASRLLRENPVACQGMSLRFLLAFEQDILLYDIKNNIKLSDTIHTLRKKLRCLQASRSQRAIYADAIFAGAVRSWLRRYRSMLVGEVVFLCVVGLEAEDIPSGRFNHVVIDEYQDLTAAEQELINLVWSRTGSLVVMGDNDQSIYGFRFNHPQGIANFHMTWSQCRDLTFSENRRCGEKILQVANLMMEEAGSEKPPMISQSGRQGQLALVQWNSLDDEIEGLAEYIRIHSDKSFLVLVLRRFVGYRLAGKVGNDARTAFSEKSLEYSIAKEAFAGISLCANPDDWVATRVWLGFHGEKPKLADKCNASAYASLPSDIGGHALIRQIVCDNLPITGPGRDQVKKRAEKALASIELNLEPHKAIDHFFNPNLSMREPDPERRCWVANDLLELRNAAHELLGEQETPDLGKVLDTLRYRIATRASLSPTSEEEPRVQIMTLHSAKGLEADNVVLAGISDQVIPGIDKNADVVAEQRRLLYVAITRAKDKLIVSWSRKIKYADARGNGIRIDTNQLFTEHNETWVGMSRSSLLPQGLGVIAGDDWLSQIAQA